MKRIRSIVKSNVAPNIDDLWLDKGELKYFGPNGWEPLKIKIEDNDSEDNGNSGDSSEADPYSKPIVVTEYVNTSITMPYATNYVIKEGFPACQTRLHSIYDEDTEENVYHLFIADEIYSVDYLGRVPNTVFEFTEVENGWKFKTSYSRSFPQYILNMFNILDATPIALDDDISINEEDSTESDSTGENTNDVDNSDLVQ